MLLGSILVFSGIFTSKAYLSYKVSSQEAAFLSEKTMNPYLRGAAQEIQQETQLANQITSILNSSVPGSKAMEIFDYYNTNGITLVNVICNINTNKEVEIRMRAKAASRFETEKIIIEFENNPYFTKIISPLSNLVGKGERFINIDLKLNTKEIISAYKQTKEEEEMEIVDSSELKAEKPSIQQTSEKQQLIN